MFAAYVLVCPYMRVPYTGWTEERRRKAAACVVVLRKEGTGDAVNQALAPGRLGLLNELSRWAEVRPDICARSVAQINWESAPAAKPWLCLVSMVHSAEKRERESGAIILESRVPRVQQHDTAARALDGWQIWPAGETGQQAAAHRQCPGPRAGSACRCSFPGICSACRR